MVSKITCVDNGRELTEEEMEEFYIEVIKALPVWRDPRKDDIW